MLLCLQARLQNAEFEYVFKLFSRYMHTYAYEWIYTSINTNTQMF